MASCAALHVWAPRAEATTYVVAQSGSATANSTYTGGTAHPANTGDSITDSNYVVNYGTTENTAGLVSLGTVALSNDSGTNETAIFNQSGGTLTIANLQLGSTNAAGSRHPNYNLSGGTVNVAALSFGGGSTTSINVNNAGSLFNFSGASFALGNYSTATGQAINVVGGTFNSSATTTTLGAYGIPAVVASINVNGGTYNNTAAATSAINLGGTGGTGGTGSIVLQNGGVFNDNGTSATLSLGLGAAGIGVVNVSSGTFNMTGTGATLKIASVAGATGTLNVSGGTFNYGGNASNLTVAGAGGPTTTGTLLVGNGGTFNAPSATTIYVANAGAANASGYVTTSGNGVLSAPLATLVLGQFGSSNTSGTITTATLTMGDTSTVTAGRVLLGGANAASYVNAYAYLNGGTLITGSVTRGATYLASVATQIAVTANGGTVQATGNNTDFFAGTYLNLAAGGLTFNTSGSAVGITNVIASSAGTTGPLVKIGAGALALSGASTFAGNTAVSAGTLVANGPLVSDGNGGATSSSTGTGAVAIAAGATLAGTGGVGMLTLNGGATITAGSGPGTSDSIGNLSTGTATLFGGTYAVKLNGATAGTLVAGSSDDLLISGLSSATGQSLTVTPIAISAFPAGSYSFVIATSTAGAFDNLASSVSTNASSPSGATSYTLGTDAGTDSELILSFTVAAPEPTSLLLAGVAAAPLVLARRRQQAHAGGRV